MSYLDTNLNTNKLNNLIIQTHKDANLKNRFITNPKQTIESELGVTINIEMTKNIVVEDQSNSDIIYLNIPKHTDLSSLNLTEEELERISGGDFGASFLTAVCVIAAGAKIIDEFTKGWNDIPTAK